MEFKGQFEFGEGKSLVKDRSLAQMIKLAEYEREFEEAYGALADAFREVDFKVRHKRLLKKILEDKQAFLVEMAELYNRSKLCKGIVIKLENERFKITEEHRTEDPISEISIDMSREVTERDLSEISPAIGSEWKLLGAALGITEVEMEHIDCDNKATPMKIFSMLTKWRRENDATVNTLYNAIQNFRPAVTFDMKVIERVFAQRN